MDNISILLAFAAGLLSFLSPCVLPLVPAYISYLTGSTIEDLKDNKKKFTALTKSIGFVVGFSTIFIIMGASITSLGRIFIKYQYILRRLGGALIFLFGLHTTGLFKVKLFYHEKRAFYLPKSNTPFGSIFMGMAFAAGWTPCVGPILSTILIYASNMNTISKGILLLIFYSLGLAVPFLLTALAIESFSKNLHKLSKHLFKLSILSGILMIFIGILIFTNKIGFLSNYLNFINI